MQTCAFSLTYRNFKIHADSRKNYTRLFKAAFYLGSFSAVFSSPVFDPAGSFSRTAAG